MPHEEKSSQAKPGLLEVMRQRMRVAHFSLFTEKTYLHWARRFIAFHQKRHPREMGAKEISEFLTFLAVEKRVSASTQNQALNALVYLYKHVLDRDPGLFEGLIRAKRPKYIPSVLSVEETRAVLSGLSGVHRLIGCLLYGTGMRLIECLRLQVKDIDFERNMILVREAKGEKDRVVPFPKTLHRALEKQLLKAKELHQADLEQGFGKVSLPYALERKYPNANKEWKW